jgi:hypothetical protein
MITIPIRPAIALQFDESCWVVNVRWTALNSNSDEIEAGQCEYQCVPFPPGKHWAQGDEAEILRSMVSNPSIEVDLIFDTAADAMACLKRLNKEVK